MELEKIQKFYQAGQEIEDLISNAYVIDFESSGAIRLQGDFHHRLIEKYREKANLIIGAGGFVLGHLEIDDLRINLVFS